MNTNVKLAYLGLGTNLGDKKANLRAAVNILNSNESVDVVALSSLYSTQPVGVKDQPDFINAVIAIQTTLSPVELLKLCNNIEHQLGRVRTIRWGPRVIDIDILLYNDVVINDNDLIIPHPCIMERAFVLIPLAEIAPDVILPGGIKASDAAHEIECIGIERINGDFWSD